MVGVLSGRETLGHLSTTLRSARKELERLDLNLQATSNSIARNRQRQAHGLKQLAALRLDAIKQGELEKRIDSADYKAREILARRQESISKLKEQVTAANIALQALEEQRDELHRDVDAAANVLAEREAAVQADLETDAAFLAQLDRTRESDAIAVSAAEKAELALDDRRQKGKPFESDELFLYLWKRAYGTSEYRANPIARLLDAWVARLCKYRDARPNYWMLLEIPKRLKQHADRVRDDAERELDELQALEKAAIEAGGVADAQSQLADLEQKQDKHDEQIAASEAALHELQIEQSKYTAGDDNYIAESLSILADSMRHHDIDKLTHLARATMTAEDDAIVDDLRFIRDQDRKLQDELGNNRRLHQEHLRRVQELEQVRKQFKSHRYDDLRSGFDKGDLIVTMMREVLGGAIRGGALWDVLRRSQQYRDVAGAWPDFGSGGVVRKPRRPPSRRAPTRRPTWHWPGSSSSKRRGGFKLPRLPRAPSKSRGGFRTGGGF